MQATFDPDGDGPTPPTFDAVVDTLFGVTNHDLTALGNPPLCFCGLPPDGTLTYTRRVYVGARNDVASVANPMLAELGVRTGFETGTISGNVDGAESADVVATGIATRTGGAALTAFPDDTPVTQFRTDASGALLGRRAAGGHLRPRGARRRARPGDRERRHRRRRSRHRRSRCRR